MYDFFKKFSESTANICTQGANFAQNGAVLLATGFKGAADYFSNQEKEKQAKQIVAHLKQQVEMLDQDLETLKQQREEVMRLVAEEREKQERLAKEIEAKKQKLSELDPNESEKVKQAMQGPYAKFFNGQLSEQQISQQLEQAIRAEILSEQESDTSLKDILLHLQNMRPKSSLGQEGNTSLEEVLRGLQETCPEILSDLESGASPKDALRLLLEQHQAKAQSALRAIQRL